MKKLKRQYIAAIFMAIASLGLAREQSPGFYVSAIGSADFARRVENSAMTQKNGQGGALAVGYFLGGPIRIEAELGTHVFENSRYYPAQILTLPGYTGEDNGKSRHLSLMANVFYDFPLNDRWDFSLGVGVGLMRFSGSISYQFIPLIYPPIPSTVAYYNIDRFAAQLLGGLTFHVTPRFAVTAGYRIAEVEKASFRYSPINTGAFSSVELGVRIRF